MPSSQALLLWLRQAAPDKFGDVIDRAKLLEGAARAGDGR